MVFRNHGKELLSFSVQFSLALNPLTLLDLTLSPLPKMASELGVLPWWEIERLATVLYSMENRIPLCFVQLSYLAKAFWVPCLDGAYHRTVLFWGVVTIARGMIHLYVFHHLASPSVWVLMERDLNEKNQYKTSAAYSQECILKRQRKWKGSTSICSVDYILIASK